MYVQIVTDDSIIVTFKLPVLSTLSTFTREFMVTILKNSSCPLLPFLSFIFLKFPPNLLCAFTGYLLSVKSLGAPVKFVQRLKAFHVLCLWIRTSKLNCLAQGYKQVPGFYLQTILQTLAQVLVDNLVGVIFCSLFAFNKPCTSFLWSQCNFIHYFLYL